MQHIAPIVDAGTRIEEKQAEEAIGKAVGVAVAGGPAGKQEERKTRTGRVAQRPPIFNAAAWPCILHSNTAHASWLAARRLRATAQRNATMAPHAHMRARCDAAVPNGAHVPGHIN